MVMLDKKILVIFCMFFLIQGCSVDGIVFGGGDKKTSTIKATDNRRIPDQNPTTEDNEDSVEINNDISVQYIDDDNKQAYQDYKANTPPKDFKEFRKKQREAELKALRLDQSMDKASALKESKVEDESMEIDEKSNLKEVIDYNKKQQAKTNNSTKSKSTTKSLEVNKKPNLNTANKSQSSEVTMSSSKTVNNANKEVTVVTIKPPVELQVPTELKNKSKHSSKKQKLEECSNPVTSNQQTNDNSNKKRKESVKPIMNKKGSSSDESPVISSKNSTKEDKVKNNPTEINKNSDISPKKDVAKNKSPITMNDNVSKENKVGNNIVKETKTPNVSLKKDVAKNKSPMTTTNTVSKDDKLENKPTAEVTKTSDVSPKKNTVDTKILSTDKTPDSSKESTMGVKDERSEIPVTYLVIDPLDAEDGSATAEVPEVTEDVKLVSPLIQDKKPEKDIRNLSHDQFKQALKEKFKKNNESKYVDEAEMDDLPEIEIIDDNLAQ